MNQGKAPRPAMGYWKRKGGQNCQQYPSPDLKLPHSAALVLHLSSERGH